ncbi:MAG: type II secretion system F family protein [Marmoricola sp.]
MTGFLILAALLGVGLMQAWRLAIPPRTDLTVGVNRWDAARDRANRRLDVTPPHTIVDKLAGRLVDALQRSGRDLTAMRQDLDITDTTIEAHLSKALALGVGGILLGVVATVWFRLLGLNFPLLAGLVAGLVLAGVMVVLTARDLHEKADVRRAEMRRALSILLDLVAMSLEAGKDHSEALPAAAQVGSGWAFTRLQDACVNAPRWEGITAWAALGRLGQRIGMHELNDLDGVLTLAQNDGSRIKKTLIARAATLRDARIADAEAEANTATKSMELTLYFMGFAFLAYEFYPPVSRLFNG